MCVITLNFLLLNYILPSIGILMIFLGLRRLRRENRWFRSAYGLAGIKLLLTIFLLIVGTYIGRERIEAAEAWKIVSILVGILPLLIFICFFYGLTIELKKRGEKAEKNNLIHMILWYALVACLAHIAGGNYNDLIIGLIFLANYIQILVSMRSLPFISVENTPTSFKWYITVSNQCSPFYISTRSTSSIYQYTITFSTINLQCSILRKV